MWLEQLPQQHQGLLSAAFYITHFLISPAHVYGSIAVQHQHDLQLFIYFKLECLLNLQKTKKKRKSLYHFWYMSIIAHSMLILIKQKPISGQRIRWLEVLETHISNMIRLALQGININHQPAVYLFTPAVKSHFHLSPCFRIMAPLHQWIVMGIFQGHFIPSFSRLIQSTQKSGSQPT